MKFHGIDAQGSLQDQRVSSLPTWTLNDIGRIVYLTTNDTIYIATSNGAYEPLSTAISLIEGAGITITTSTSPTLQTTIGISGTTYDDITNFLASGRKLWLFEAAAPTGWYILTACADGLLAVGGGTSPGYTLSGVAGQGTWTQSSHTHTVTIDAGGNHLHSMTHTHLTNSHVLTLTEIPAHHHLFIYGAGAGGPDASNGGHGELSKNTENAGGGAGHDHGATQSNVPDTSAYSGTHTHTDTVSVVSPGASWRPLANTGIVVQKA